MADGVSGPSVAELGLTQKDLGVAVSKVEKQNPYSEMVNKAVDKYAAFFGLPPDVAERARKVEVIEGFGERYKVESEGSKRDYVDVMLKARESYTDTQDPQRLAQIDERIKKVIEGKDNENVEQCNGMYINRAYGRELIILNSRSDLPRQKTIDHEILHAVASRGFEKGSGFHPGPEDAAFTDFRSNMLNEGTTELLRVAADMGEQDVNNVISAILRKKVPFSYKEYVQWLCWTLQSTYRKDGKPISIQDLAEYNLKSKDKSAKDSLEDFRNLLTESVPGDSQYLVASLVSKRSD